MGFRLTQIPDSIGTERVTQTLERAGRPRLAISPLIRAQLTKSALNSLVDGGGLA